MKIHFFDVKDNEREIIERLSKEMLPDDEVSVSPESLSEDYPLAASDNEVISPRETSKVDATVLQKFPNLKFISARITGYDNIDLAVCKEKNILVSNVPSYGEHTVAEFTFALILMLSRRMYECEQSVKDTKKFCSEGLTGVDLYGKTLGVVGTGRIGQHVIEMAKGFAMRVIAFDAFPRPELQKDLSFTYEPFDKVLAESDFITLHVPYIKETHHLINQEAFSKMKTGARIINTSRGAVIDTPALIEALKSGKTSAAGLDVLEDEHGNVNQELLNMKNVVITPHNAFNTIEAVERRVKTTIENIVAFQKGTPQNLVK